MLTQDLIDKIRAQITLLYQHSESIDQRNCQIKSSRFKYRAFFNTSLFRCESVALVDYVREADENFQSLLRSQQGDNSLLISKGEQLTDQLQALTQMLRANEVALKEHFYQVSSNKKRYGQYKKAANAVMANSHQLHQELAKNHEYERRLSEMIDQRQSQLAAVDQHQAQQLQKEVLALHQRLGRCRKAISMVEERIQLAESKRY